MSTNRLTAPPLANRRKRQQWLQTMRPITTRWLAVGLLVAAAFSLACQPPGSATAAADGEATDDSWNVDVGFLTFPTSGTPEAQEHFLRGVAILHSFGYKQAIEQFQKAQELDPDFAMAYWGESLCYNHPLLPERDLESPREVLARLGATPEERAAKAPTQREKDFLGAVEILFGEGEAGDRRIAYMEAMERMHETYPDDPEVGAYFALSLLAASGPMGDDTYRMAVRAGAIALDIFDENPDHPGAAHYIIHAFDDPVHAPLALPAAFRFAEIAAAVSHARHMPSHIFIQRGMWDRVSASNDSAYEAAVNLWETGDAVNDMVHSLDWGHYGDLQRGDWEKAKGWRELLEEIIVKSERAERAVATADLLWAREVVETESWETREITDETRASVALATGLSAVVAGDMATAKQAEQRLATLGSREVKDRSTFQRGTGPARVAHREVAARIQLAQGNTSRALELLDEGIEISRTMGPPRGSASPVKPIRELYGEILLELGRPEDAADKFEYSLLYMPNRPRSLLGLARASAQAGDEESARRAYQKLAEIWAGRDHIPGLQEAQQYLAESQT